MVHSQCWASVDLYFAGSQYWKHESMDRDVSEKQAMIVCCCTNLEKARQLATRDNVLAHDVSDNMQ